MQKIPRHIIVPAILALGIAAVVSAGMHLSTRAMSNEEWMQIYYSRGGRHINDNRDILRALFQKQAVMNNNYYPIQKNAPKMGRARPRQLPKREGDKWREEEPLRPSGTLQVPDDTSED